MYWAAAAVVSELEKNGLNVYHLEDKCLLCCFTNPRYEIGARFSYFYNVCICNKSIWCFVCLFTSFAGYRCSFWRFHSIIEQFNKAAASCNRSVVSQSTNMFILLYGIWTHSKIEHAQKANRTCCLEHITKTAFHTHKGSNLL